jgi:hypothetical protein
MGIKRAISPEGHMEQQRESAARYLQRNRKTWSSSRPSHLQNMAGEGPKHEAKMNINQAPVTAYFVW